MQSSSILTDLMLSTLWFAVFYFVLGRAKHLLYAEVREIVRLFDIRLP